MALDRRSFLAGLLASPAAAAYQKAAKTAPPMRIRRIETVYWKSREDAPFWPHWTSTFYTMLLLWDLGLDPTSERTQHAIGVVRDQRDTLEDQAAAGEVAQRLAHVQSSPQPSPAKP